MIPHRNILINVKSLTIPYFISLPNGYKVKVICTGSLPLNSNMILQRVPLVRSFKCNLICLSKLLLQFNCITYFNVTSFILQDHSPERPLKVDKLSNRLYILQLNGSSFLMDTISNYTDSSNVPYVVVSFSFVFHVSNISISNPIVNPKDISQSCFLLFYFNNLMYLLCPSSINRMKVDSIENQCSKFVSLNMTLPFFLKY